MLPRRPARVPLCLLALVAAALLAAVAGSANAQNWIPCSEAELGAGPPTQTGTEPVPPCPEPPPEAPPPGTTTPEEPPPGTTTPEEPPVVTEPGSEAKPKPKPKPQPADTTATVEAEPTPTPTTGIFPAGSRVARPPQTITPPLGGGPYVFPVLGPVSYTDTWGAARATVSWHHGVDIFAPLGAPIVAVADGTVHSVGWNRIGGWRLWLRDREGNYFYYAHLSAFSPAAVENASVRAGTVLGFVGNTGDAVGTPYHLHFEVHPVSLLHLGYDGAVNPTPYITAWRRLDTASTDVSIVAGLRWGSGADAAGAGVPAAQRAVAPAAGAILLGYSDIASAERVSDADLEAPELELLPLDGPDDPPGPPPRRPAPQPPAELPVFDVSYADMARRLDAEATQPAHVGLTVWDRLAKCEAGGDWSANTGNGYFGGLQFHPQTWAAYGGGEYAASADQATREQQITVAVRVLGGQGWNAWPACSAMLALR